MAELSWRLGLSAREITTILMNREKMTASSFDEVFRCIKGIATDLHKAGLLTATAQDDDLFLRYKKAT